MTGFSPRNLKYMRAVAEAWDSAPFVQQVVAQIPWGHVVRILDRVKNSRHRQWYLGQTVRHGWSRNVGKDARERDLEQGLLDHVRDFLLELGGDDFYLSAVDDLMRRPDDHPSIGVILCKERNRVVVEYALRDTAKPIGVSACKLAQHLPGKLKGRLPTAVELEAEPSGENNGTDRNDLPFLATPRSRGL